MSIFHIRTCPQLSGNGDKYQGASRMAFFFEYYLPQGSKHVSILYISAHGKR